MSPAFLTPSFNIERQMLGDYVSWGTPWELYFHILIFIPIVQRLIMLGEPALKAIQIHGHHLKWLFDRQIYSWSFGSCNYRTNEVLHI